MLCQQAIRWQTGQHENEFYDQEISPVLAFIEQSRWNKDNDRG